MEGEGKEEEKRMRWIRRHTEMGFCIKMGGSMSRWNREI